LCTIFDKLKFRIWKSVLHEDCRQFDKLSNGVEYEFIGLTELELWLFYSAAVFLLARNFRFLARAYAHELPGISKGHYDGNSHERAFELP
jgi:hypothetical protein